MLVFFFFWKTLCVDGWTHVEVPDGWTLVLRGPRPKAEKWPHQSVRKSSAAQMPAKPQCRGRWRHRVAQPQQHTTAQVLQSALEALGPEDSNCRVGIETALKRLKDQTQAATEVKLAPVPEAMFEAARVRSSKLEEPSRPWESSRVQKFSFSRELWHVPESLLPRLLWTCS